MQRSAGYVWGSSPLAQTRLPDGGQAAFILTFIAHNSMGFFGVKKRHPYPSGYRSFGVEAIIHDGITARGLMSTMSHEQQHVQE
jgi:hypothetical protein